MQIVLVTLPTSTSSHRMDVIVGNLLVDQDAVLHTQSPPPSYYKSSSFFFLFLKRRPRVQLLLPEKNGPCAAEKKKQKGKNTFVTLNPCRVFGDDIIV